MPDWIATGHGGQTVSEQRNFVLLPANVSVVFFIPLDRGALAGGGVGRVSEDEQSIGVVRSNLIQVELQKGADLAHASHGYSHEYPPYTRLPNLILQGTNEFSCGIWEAGSSEVETPLGNGEETTLYDILYGGTTSTGNPVLAHRGRIYWTACAAGARRD